MSLNDKYNRDKPHRCPHCHAVAIRGDRVKSLLTLASVECCKCGAEFTRWPWLPVFKRRGVVA